MPHGLRVYGTLCETDLNGERALAVGNIVATARGPTGFYNEEVVVNLLCDAGFTEEQGEAVARALACCFPSERFKRSFTAAALKFNMVRSGISAACADAVLDAIDPCITTGRDAEVRAPIPHVPGPGRVVMCDFTFLAKPEMQKQRRAIVVSKRFSSIKGRCKVVPVSKDPSNGGHPLHHEFAPGAYPFFHQTEPVWAVCDHVYTVGLGRLWQVNVNRKPQLPPISDADLEAIRGMLGTSFGA